MYEANYEKAYYFLLLSGAFTTILENSTERIIPVIAIKAIVPAKAAVLAKAALALAAAAFDAAPPPPQPCMSSRARSKCAW
ncbi:hypothetical protein [Parasitella parasitica]|uniref:Uncharacterized protein n=1 Tax=Parasitella parasitica TaxID=35722 RepID=A0A0B7MVJ2_9FUNG|nr:hypothetical protein [Parasitella parasitica]